MSLETLLEAAKYLEYRSQASARGEEPEDYYTFANSNFKGAESDENCHSLSSCHQDFGSLSSSSLSPVSSKYDVNGTSRSLYEYKDKRRVLGAGTREVHNKLEKNRRAHLKECFELLKSQLPGIDDRKTSNLCILRCALRCIQSLKRRERDYAQELERLSKNKARFQQRLVNLKREITSRGKFINIDALMPDEDDIPDDVTNSTSTASECGMFSDTDDAMEFSPPQSPKYPNDCNGHTDTPIVTTKSANNVPVQACTVLNGKFSHHHHVDSDCCCSSSNIPNQCDKKYNRNFASEPSAKNVQSSSFFSSVTTYGTPRLKQSTNCNENIKDAAACKEQVQSDMKSVKYASPHLCDASSQMSNNSTVSLLKVPHLKVESDPQIIVQSTNLHKLLVRPKQEQQQLNSVNHEKVSSDAVITGGSIILADNSIVSVSQHDEKNRLPSNSGQLFEIPKQELIRDKTQASVLQNNAMNSPVVSTGLVLCNSAISSLQESVNKICTTITAPSKYVQSSGISLHANMVDNKRPLLMTKMMIPGNTCANTIQQPKVSVDRQQIGSMARANIPSHITVVRSGGTTFTLPAQMLPSGTLQLSNNTPQGTLLTTGQPTLQLVAQPKGAASMKLIPTTTATNVASFVQPTTYAIMKTPPPQQQQQLNISNKLSSVISLTPNYENIINATSNVQNLPNTSTSKPELKTIPTNILISSAELQKSSSNLIHVPSSSSVSKLQLVQPCVTSSGNVKSMAVNKPSNPGQITPPIVSSPPFTFTKFSFKHVNTDVTQSVKSTGCLSNQSQVSVMTMSSQPSNKPFTQILHQTLVQGIPSTNANINPGTLMTSSVSKKANSNIYQSSPLKMNQHNVSVNSQTSVNQASSAFPQNITRLSVLPSATAFIPQEAVLSSPNVTQLSRVIPHVSPVISTSTHLASPVAQIVASPAHVTTMQTNVSSRSHIITSQPSQSNKLFSPHVEFRTMNQIPILQQQYLQPSSVKLVMSNVIAQPVVTQSSASSAPRTAIVPTNCSAVSKK